MISTVEGCSGDWTVRIEGMRLCLQTASKGFSTHWMPQQGNFKKMRSIHFPMVFSCWLEKSNPRKSAAFGMSLRIGTQGTSGFWLEMNAERRRLAGANKKWSGDDLNIAIQRKCQKNYGGQVAFKPFWSACSKGVPALTELNRRPGISVQFQSKEPGSIGRI